MGSSTECREEGGEAVEGAEEVGVHDLTGRGLGS